MPSVLSAVRRWRKLRALRRRDDRLIKLVAVTARKLDEHVREVARVQALDQRRPRTS